MRTSYHEELDAIIDNLVSMAELVEVAIREGAESLLTADLTRAESVMPPPARPTPVPAATRAPGPTRARAEIRVGPARAPAEIRVGVAIRAPAGPHRCPPRQ